MEDRSSEVGENLKGIAFLELIFKVAAYRINTHINF